MNTRLLVALTILSLLLSASSGVAADKTDASTELKALVSKIQTKLREGKKTEADLADELKQFDALLAAHKGASTLTHLAFCTRTVFTTRTTRSATGQSTSGTCQSCRSCWGVV